MKTIKEKRDFFDKPYARVILLGLIPLAIICTPLLLFFHTFGKYGLSKNNGDWSNFSTFLNSFVLFCNVYLFVLLTLWVDRYTRKRNQEADNFQKGLAQPILIFKTAMTEGDENEKKEIWHIENIGNGAALNLKIGEWVLGKWFGKPVKGYSLGNSRELILDWLQIGAILCVTYEDTFKKKYVTIGVGDESYPTTIDEWEDIDLSSLPNFTKNDLKEFNNLEAIRISKARDKGDKPSTIIKTTTSQTG
jgi:hypothetical protein